MNDPYVTLGVSRSASDEEIKAAYRELARKYHPDKYADNPLADLAQEKMKEINEAYDTIQKERAGGSQRFYSAANHTANRSGHSAGAYADARSAINSGDLDRAEMILGSITDRGAEWNFLMGSLMFRRGWMDDAARYFRTASMMDPNNTEYRQALRYMENNGRTPYTGTRQSGLSSDDTCDICGKLLVADCCCELLGGDLIPCC